MMNMTSKLILPTGYKNNNIAIIDRIRKDMSQLSETKPHYLFTGCVGSGKTHLKQIIFDSLTKSFTKILERSYKTERCFDFKNFDKMKGNAILASNEYYIQGLIDCISCHTASELYKHYLASDFQSRQVTRIFCLDDIGAEKETPASRDLVIDMITSIYDRFKLGKNLFVIITTNLDRDGLVMRYGDRVVDRIYEMCVIMQFNKKSFRRDKAEVIKREVK